MSARQLSRVILKLAWSLTIDIISTRLELPPPPSYIAHVLSDGRMPECVEIS